MVYTALGIDPHDLILDPLDRPHPLELGDPIVDVLR